ncbi:MAG: hypothetical protein IID61_16900 [SAR324 cluster bacterium]|nr:hypothetical protein [SAR324 cluster bacterium]
MMEWKISLDVLAILGALFLGWLAIWIYRKTSALIELRLSPVWASRTDDIAILKIEVINRSKATVKKGHILLQILEFDAPESGELSEFIPFTEKARQLTAQQPRSWREATKVLETTIHLLPGEHIVVERLYKWQGGELIQYGLQFRAKFNALWRFLNATIFKSMEQWTTTGWFGLP